MSLNSTAVSYTYVVYYRKVCSKMASSYRWGELIRVTARDVRKRCDSHVSVSRCKSSSAHRHTRVLADRRWRWRRTTAGLRSRDRDSRAHLQGLKHFLPGALQTPAGCPAPCPSICKCPVNAVGLKNRAWRGLFLNAPFPPLVNK